VAARDGGGGGGRRRHERASEVAVVAEQLGLDLDRPAGDRVPVAGGQRQRPAAGRAAAGDLGHHSRERVEAELVAAEAARLEDPVEPGIHERAMGAPRQRAQALALLLAGEQPRPQARRALDHLVRRQVGFRDGHRSMMAQLAASFSWVAAQRYRRAVSATITC
jgi:hypothetical protein